MNLTYSKNIDTTVLDKYLEPEIVGNIINDKIHYLQSPENLVLVTVPDTYKYRPERIAHQYYGHESYYPLILAANNIGSIFHFIPSHFNNQIKMIKSDVVRKILNI